MTRLRGQGEGCFPQLPGELGLSWTPSQGMPFVGRPGMWERGLLDQLACLDLWTLRPVVCPNAPSLWKKPGDGETTHSETLMLHRPPSEGYNLLFLCARVST